MRILTWQNFTRLALADWQYGSGQAELMCADILMLDGYCEIQSQAPGGGPDGGKDILCTKNATQFVAACHFPRGVKKFSAILGKFRKDLLASLSHSVGGFIFMTNQDLTLGQVKILEEMAKSKVSSFGLYNGNRIRALLDSPFGVAIRSRRMGITMSEEEKVVFSMQLHRLQMECARRRDEDDLSLLSRVERMLQHLSSADAAFET